MADKKSQVVIVYLDPYITGKLDEVIEQSSNHVRGNLISSSLSFLVYQGEAEIEKYIAKAQKLVEKSSQIDRGKKFGTIRVGKVRINLNLKPALANYFKTYDKKLLVIAALLFVKVIKNK
jgi:hypothetical protein